MWIHAEKKSREQNDLKNHFFYVVAYNLLVILVDIKDLAVENLLSEIKVVDRKKISLTGVKKLVSFDPEEFLMDTTLGPLVLKGSNLEIVKLDTLAGNLNIKGKVNSISYLDGRDIKNKGNVLTKLFKWK